MRNQKGISMSAKKTPEQLVDEHFTKWEKDFPVLSFFVKDRIRQTLAGTIPPLQGLNEEMARRVRTICGFHGLVLPT